MFSASLSQHVSVKLTGPIECCTARCSAGFRIATFICSGLVERQPVPTAGGLKNTSTVFVYAYV